MSEISWKVNIFEELDINDLYELLRLRSEVFVVEQNCVYQDIDNKDQKAIHIRGFAEGELAAYCRIFKAGDYFEETSIGRVVVSPKWRHHNFGHYLIEKAIKVVDEVLNEKAITISGQLYLQRFYEAHNFVQTSEEYLEDGIPHIQMKKQ